MAVRMGNINEGEHREMNKENHDIAVSHLGYELNDGNENEDDKKTDVSK